MSTTPHPAIAQARELIAAGNLDAADALISRALEVARTDCDLVYLRGTIATRRGQHQVALTLFEQAVSLAPTKCDAWLALGHAHARSGKFAAALQAYERAATLDDAAADIQYNIGVARHALRDLHGAALAFHRAWRRDPAFAQAAKACVGTVGQIVRSDEAARPPSSTPPAVRASVSVVVCSIDDGKAQRVEACYHRALAGVAHEVIVLRDATSLAEAYNRGIARAAGEIVILSHDDIDLPSPSFAPRLAAHLAVFDVVGVVGATRIAGPVPVWAGHPYLRGWIAHQAGPAAPLQAGMLHPDPCAGNVAVLDGVLLAARRAVFQDVPFDERTFDGFHGYDVDWSARAAERRYRLCAAGDLAVVHASRGRYDATWQVYAERFCSKHAIEASEPAPPPYYETTLADPGQVARFFDLMIDLHAAGSNA